MRSVKIFLTFLFIFMAFTGLPLDIYFFFHPASSVSYYANVKLTIIKSVGSLLSALFVILILQEEDLKSIFIKVSKVMAGRFLALAMFFNIFFFITSYSFFVINIFSVSSYDVHYLTYLWVFILIVYFLSLLFHKRVYKKFKKIVDSVFPTQKNIEEAGVKA